MSRVRFLTRAKTASSWLFVVEVDGTETPFGPYSSAGHCKTVELRARAVFGRHDDPQQALLVLRQEVA